MISLIQTKILEKQLHLLLGFSKFSRFFNKRLIFPKTNLFLRQFSRFFKKTLRFLKTSLQMGCSPIFQYRKINIYLFTISRYWKISSHVIISNITKSIYHRRVNWYWKILLLVLYNWSITSYNLMYITWKIGILFCPKCCFSILRCNINFLKNKNLHEFTYTQLCIIIHKKFQTLLLMYVRQKDSNEKFTRT